MRKRGVNQKSNTETPVTFDRQLLEDPSIASLWNAKKLTTLISDLDNTLWDGTLAERQLVSLNADYYTCLKKLGSVGIVEFVVSKNETSDVDTAFLRLGIDRELFASVVANWDPKYLSIERLLEFTGIRPETVVFIDDNPLERAEVKARLPAIHCLDAVHWPILLEHPYLKVRDVQTAAEIEHRINRYRTAVYSQVLREQCGEDAEFYCKLNRELSIGKIEADNLERVTRLFVETHRINFNPGKFEQYTAALEYLYARLNAGDQIYAVSTKEGGHSLGLTGALLLHRVGRVVQVTDATFSCGIIGRGFEEIAFLTLMEKLRVEGADTIEVFVKLTQTNKRVTEILERLHFVQTARIGENVTFSCSLTDHDATGPYGWIRVSSETPEFEYIGHPHVISFFEKSVMPLMTEDSHVVNLGSARGEVIGHLQPASRQRFYDFIRTQKVHYTKIDSVYYPEEDNVVANAENLLGVMPDQSQDLVMAIELLEHTEHFWSVINEMTRICKSGGYIFITVPSFSFPKHEYPIDAWRIGPKTLNFLFPEPHFKVVDTVIEGPTDAPWRTMILVQKLDNSVTTYGKPEAGNHDWQNGLTIFP